MPFYKKLEGQPSNSLHIQTLEDVPSAPPTNIRSEMINKTSASLSWAPPPPQHRNGILKGEVYFELIGLPYSRLRNKNRGSLLIFGLFSRGYVPY
jgi:hypothetical protein